MICETEDSTRKAEMPEKTYDHNEIELKWHERWKDDSLYKAEENSAKPKYYVLEMLPYPSGDLHVGHAKNYTLGDAVARMMRMPVAPVMSETT